MAIGTDAFVEFYGTQDAIGTSSASVADAAFSIAGDLSTWTNDDDAPFAAIVFSGTFSVAPDANSVVELYVRMLNIVSTNDEDIPDANNAAGFLGTFALNDVTSAQYRQILVKLPSGKTSAELEFYIRNSGGQTLSAGWDINVTPIAIGPHA